MSMENDNFKRLMTPEIMKLLRAQVLALDGDKIKDRAKKIAPQFTQFKYATVLDYTAACMSATEAAFQNYVEGKISLGIFLELSRWEKKDQDFLLAEVLEKKMTPTQLRDVKRLRKEEGEGFAVAIGKATGVVPEKDPAKDMPRRSIDSILDDIAKSGAKLRGSISMAIDLIGKEEGSAGIHQGLLEKTYLLRHFIGENYDFMQKRLNRYMHVLRKKAGEAAEEKISREEGDPDVIEAEATVIEHDQPIPYPMEETPAVNVDAGDPKSK